MDGSIHGVVGKMMGRKKGEDHRMNFRHGIFCPVVRGRKEGGQRMELRRSVCGKTASRGKAEYERKKFRHGIFSKRRWGDELR